MPVVTTRYPRGTPSWVRLTTPDPPAALAFYRHLFGWQGETDQEVRTLHGHVVAGITTTPVRPPMWITCLAADDADATRAAINATGGTAPRPVTDVGTLGRTLTATDPTGAEFGVWQPLALPGAQLVNRPGTLAWNELRTGDPELAGAFYSDVFGLRPTRTPGVPHYWTLTAAGRPVGGLTTTAPGIGPHWLTRFAVDDADRTADALLTAGGTVLTPPADTPYGRAALVRDPQGATFGVIAVPPP